MSHSVTDVKLKTIFTFLSSYEGRMSLSLNVTISCIHQTLQKFVLLRLLKANVRKQCHNVYFNNCFIINYLLTFIFNCNDSL